MATMLEQCRVAPPPGEVAELSLPLTYFDIPWLDCHPIYRLLFYEFPCSNTDFVETIVPNLKTSLSLTLKHFVPLAANLIYPLTSGMPFFRYLSGNSVFLTIAQYPKASDFDQLTANRPRNADDFYAFVPKLPSAKTESDSKVIPLLALQVTLFPNTGICIGFSNHHAIGDASALVGFIKAWCSIAKLGGDEQFLAGDSQPLYDRSVVKDPKGLAMKFLNNLSLAGSESFSLKFPTNKVRATYVLCKEDIKKLRDLAMAKRPSMVHLSSFTITVAYVWTCLARSAEASGEDIDDEEIEYFTMAVDLRARVDPPVPATYFGNFVGLALAEVTHGQLKGDDGFLNAADRIGEVIAKKVNKKGEILKDTENWISMFESLMGKRMFGVSGSPKFDLYDTDYGWGKPKKYESVSIDGERSMSLCKSREFEGGLEIGLSLSKTEMDEFAAIFVDGLKI